MRNDQLSSRVRPLIGVCLGLAVLLVAARPAPAFQFPGVTGQDRGFGFGRKQDQLGEGDRVPKLEAGITKPAADGSAQLFIVATMPGGAHTYSITQPDGGPIRTKIKVEPTADVPTIGKFHTVGKPQVKHDENLFPRVAIEEQAGKVKWFAPIKLAAKAKPESVKIAGKVLMQLCDDNGCAFPKDYEFTAKYRPDVAAEKEPPENPPAKGKAEPAPPAAAKSTATGANPGAVPPKDGATSDVRGAGSSQSMGGAAPEGETATAVSQPPAAIGEINWLPFTNVAELREIVNPKKFDIGQVQEDVKSQDSAATVLDAVFWGFVGGLILNVMPCVLPVIGLKILSFVQQSGQNRRRALMLNVCYSLGLVAVFLALGALAVLFHLGWGELFGLTWFKIALAAVVFVMSLSFMGIWEVPLPTFLGGGRAAELAGQEGAVGAFSKGVLTTFLATPCSAPLLAPAVAWATSQPAVVTLTVFLSAGLGMASPYLLIGAFPELVRFLPKPGAWMETFKQFMGFVLMGTVVYLLALLKPYDVVPTAGLLFGLSFMCWLVGRTGPEQDFGVKLRAWLLGAIVVGVAWIAMFRGLDERVLGRFHFSGLATVMAANDARPAPSVNKPAAPRIAGPKTVLVDFTASWCLTCHYYENMVLNTNAVVEAMRQHDVVALKADWSNRDPKVSEMLDILGSRQVPVIAIFSARDPNHPIIFRGSYTQQAILDALEKAAEPSRVVAVQ